MVCGQKKLSGHQGRTIFLEQPVTRGRHAGEGEDQRNCADWADIGQLFLRGLDLAHLFRRGLALYLAGKCAKFCSVHSDHDAEDQPNERKETADSKPNSGARVSPGGSQPSRVDPIQPAAGENGQEGGDGDARGDIDFGNKMSHELLPRIGCCGESWPDEEE